MFMYFPRPIVINYASKWIVIIIYIICNVLTNLYRILNYLTIKELLEMGKNDHKNA